MRTKALSRSKSFNYRPLFGEFSTELRTIELFGNTQPAELTHIL